jgi:hypothetical protein
VVESDVEILDEYNNNLGALLVVRSNPSVYANCQYGGLYRAYSSGTRTYYLSAYGHAASSYSFGTWYRVKIIANGNNFSLYVNNSLISSGTSSTYSSGYAGLAAQASHASLIIFLSESFLRQSQPFLSEQRTHLFFR